MKDRSGVFGLVTDLGDRDEMFFGPHIALVLAGIAAKRPELGAY